MSCGVTKVQNSTTVTCDNAGTSSHAGNHSGMLPSTWTLFPGITWTTAVRVSWKAGATSVVKQKAATLGESDFA